MDIRKLLRESTARRGDTEAWRRRFAVSGCDKLAPLLGVSAVPNVLMVLGNGTQGFFFNDDRNFILRDRMEKHFGVDAFIDDLARECHDKFSVITLNISWAFENQFPFHGSLANANIPDTNMTNQNVSAALVHVTQTFDATQPVHVVFLGVGLTDRNGKGICEFLKQIRAMYGLSRVTVVDPAPLTSSRTKWLNDNCGLDRQVQILHIGKRADEWLAPLAAGIAYSGPTFEQMRQVLESPAINSVMVTNDTRVIEFVRKLISQNGLSFDTSTRVKRQKKSQDCTCPQQ